jgi:hypothetical protein
MKSVKSLIVENMNKRVNTDDIDESFLLASVRKDKTIEPNVQPPSLPVTAKSEQSPKEESPVVPETPKEEGKRKRKSQDYETLFIKESNETARLGKTVYLRKEYHDRITKIIQVIGGNEISLFSYVDNVLAHHFDNFQDDITQLYEQKNSSIF